MVSSCAQTRLEPSVESVHRLGWNRQQLCTDPAGTVSRKCAQTRLEPSAGLGGALTTSSAADDAAVAVHWLMAHGS